MSGPRWKNVTLMEDGNPIPAWTRDGYLIYLSRNHGKLPPEPGKGHKDRSGHLWWYEVFTVDESGKELDIVGEAPTLARAKNVAVEHRPGAGE